MDNRKTTQYYAGREGYRDQANCPYAPADGGAGFNTSRFLWMLGYYHERIVQIFGEDILTY